MSAIDGSVLHGETWHTPPTMAAKGVEYQRQADGSNLAILSGQAQQWATPDANAMERTNRSDSPNAAVRPTLALAAANWATPRATDGTKGGPNQRGSAGDLMLPGMAAQWATPTSSENSNRTTKMAPTHGNGHGIVLAGQAADMTNSLRPVHSTLYGRELSPTARTLRRRLNPAFACWLMGWPIWWTNPAITNSVKLETELWRYKLASQLSRLLGEPEFFKDETKQETEVNQMEVA